ncbi:MAG: hypothetical protein O7E52_16150 [Candidatus Poribacteria bacterium]|nr:hypothetical protein [Candidatus Poribacteria bacterium]
MAKRRNPRRKRVRRKLTAHSEHAPLAALAPVISEKEIFEPIHRHIEIPQKTVDYRPTDKLVFVVLGILAGAETVSTAIPCGDDSVTGRSVSWLLPFTSARSMPLAWV